MGSASRWARILGLALPACALSVVHAEPVFPVSNQAALARSAALPTLGDVAVPAAGQNDYRLALDWTNEYYAGNTADESMILDGETQRYTFGWRHGFAGGWSLDAELPLLSTGGGVLDSTIESWHHFWGLPNGGRGDAPQNRYLYQYVRNGQTQLQVDHGATGFGDAQLGASYAVAPSLALRAMLKLPSGSRTKLTGGNPGGALWVEYDPFAGSARWFGFIAGGASVNGDRGVLNGQQRRVLALGGAGAGFRLTPAWSLLLQTYAHSPLYKESSLEPLRRAGLQLAFGGRYQVTRLTAITLGFEEDPVVASSPDFSIHADLRWR